MRVLLRFEDVLRARVLSPFVLGDACLGDGEVLISPRPCKEELGRATGGLVKERCPRLLLTREDFLGTNLGGACSGDIDSTEGGGAETDLVVRRMEFLEGV